MARTDDQPGLIALGAFIRQRRVRLGLTQEALARRLDTTQEHVSSLERGRAGMPRVSTLAALADALEVRLGDLLRAAGYDV